MVTDRVISRDPGQGVDSPGSLDSYQRDHSFPSPYAIWISPSSNRLMATLNSLRMDDSLT